MGNRGRHREEVFAMSQPSPLPHATAGTRPDIEVSWYNARGDLLWASDGFLRRFAIHAERAATVQRDQLFSPEMPAALPSLIDATLKQSDVTAGYITFRTHEGKDWSTFTLLVKAKDGHVALHLPALAQWAARADAAYADADQGSGSSHSGRTDLRPLKEAVSQQHAASFVGPTAEAAQAEASQQPLGSAEDAWQASLAQLPAALTAMREDASALSVQFKGIRGIPTNLRIAAVRLGDSGLPLIAISENYSLMCRDIWSHLEVLSVGEDGGFDALLRQTSDAHLMSVAVSLLRAVQPSLKDDEGPEGAPDLGGLLDTLQFEAQGRLTQIMTRAHEIARAFAELKRLVSGLDMTRVLCRVESGRLSSDKGEALGGIITHLDSFHSSVGARLKALDQRTADVLELNPVITRNDVRAVGAAP